MRLSGRTRSTLTSSAHSHDRNNSTTHTFSHGHDLDSRGSIGNHDHSHTFEELGKNNSNARDSGEPNVSVVVDNVQRTTLSRTDNHSHGISYATDATNGGGAVHAHGVVVEKNLNADNSSHTHTNLSASAGTNANAINVPLTPTYREIRLIKKLAYQ